MYNQLVRVATHAPGRLLVKLRRIFPNRRMPSTGTRQLSGKAIGALNAPQPRSLSNMGGGNRGAPKAEAQEIVTSILSVPEQEVPVRKHGHSRRRSHGVKRAPRCTAHLDPSGCSVEVHQGVGVKSHILVDMVQDNLGIRGTIQPRSDGPQGSQGAFHGRVIRRIEEPTNGLQRVRVNVNLRQLGEEITGPSHCLRHGKQLDIVRSAKPTSMPLLMDIPPKPPCMSGHDSLQREGDRKSVV